MAWRGEMNGWPVAGAEVVEDAGRWNQVWRRLQRDTPFFDFTNAVAVVAYAGQQPTSGYGIEFLNPVAQGDDLVVTWQIVPPPSDSLELQVLTQPWEVQAFPRPKGNVVVAQLVVN
ncbi:MAG: protease complex subunit PrcB family protein [Holophaga sp.]|jgi:hypothetical protein